MATYVLVHGAWHDGTLLAETANAIRDAGHVVHTPTLAGNREGDAKTTGLEEAVASLVDFIADQGLTDAILVGHSYGGMVITGAADRLPEGTVRRLVYWSAFVPNDGECLEDMVPENIRRLFASVEAADGSIMMPFPIWREAFMNDADLALAQSAYDRLNPHPRRTFTDPIRLSRNPADFTCGKSYIHCQEDMALPGSLPWFPRLSEKLGLHRYVWMPGGHEVCFTDPGLLAQKIVVAGRD